MTETELPSRAAVAETAERAPRETSGEKILPGPRGRALLLAEAGPREGPRRSPRGDAEGRGPRPSSASRARTETPERGVRLEKVAGGWRFVTRPEFDCLLRKFHEVTERSRLSLAALETLAIIAYRQPITLPEIQDIRGVNSSSVLKTLFEKKLITTAGKKPVVGTPFFYRTTHGLPGPLRPERARRAAAARGPRRRPRGRPSRRARSPRRRRDRRRSTSKAAEDGRGSRRSRRRSRRRAAAGGMTWRSSASRRSSRRAASPRAARPRSGSARAASASTAASRRSATRRSGEGLDQGGRPAHPPGDRRPNLPAPQQAEGLRHDRLGSGRPRHGAASCCPGSCGAGVKPVGRLDVQTEGLLLLTDDGDLARLVTHPSTGCPKEYMVKVPASRRQAKLEKLRRGICARGRADAARARSSASPARRRSGEAEGNTWLRGDLPRAARRQIRRMFEPIGHPVSKLKRVAIGPIRDARAAGRALSPPRSRGGRGPETPRSSPR